jgi:hypothetical protein
MKQIRIFPLLTVLILTPLAIRQATTSAASASAPQAQTSQPPAVRVVDLKVSDGTLLKASYFAAAKPGPGVLLLHQGNRTRKAWDELAAQLAAAGINSHEGGTARPCAPIGDGADRTSNCHLQE